MNDQLHKFPSTPHLVWLGRGRVRDDKVLTPVETESFLSNPLIVEEKIDGANLGLSLDSKGQLRFQNRGNWLRGKLTGQWEHLRYWAAEHEAALRLALPRSHILFGEWCYARHSIRYDHLPDWFLAFDVYDWDLGKFWGVSRRDALAEETGLSTIGQISKGMFSKAEIIAMVNGRSSYTNGPREGIYLRREEDGWLVDRAKIVRAEFTQAIVEHWSSKAVVPNKVAGTAAAK